MIYFRYAFAQVAKKTVFNIVVMLELAIILLVGNLTIAAANSRSVYYDPYKEIMNCQGCIYTITGGIRSEYDRELKLKKIYDSLDGSPTVRYGYLFQAFTNERKLLNPLFDSEMTERNIYAFDDSIYSKFNLPLEEGRWASSKKNSLGQIEAVVIRNKDIKITLGDVYKFYVASVSQDENNDTKIDYGDFCDVVVVGIIGNNQYVPSIMVSGKTGKTNVLGAYRIESESNPASFFVSAAVDEKLRDDRTINMSTAFITYKSTPSDEILKENNKKLQAIGRCTVMDMSSFKNNSDYYLYEQYIKLLPILLCVFLIVLVELICSVAMNTKEQLRSYGIYFLCGCRWRDVLRISLSYSLIILAGGLILGGAAMAVFQTTEYAKMFEQNLALNNVWMTLALIGFMLLVSLIIPFVQVSRTSPVSTIKEN